MQTQEEIIKKINELDVERIKLIGKLELLQEQEKELKTTQPTAE